jgi:hypothetical protein
MQGLWVEAMRAQELPASRPIHTTRESMPLPPTPSTWTGVPLPFVTRPVQGPVTKSSVVLRANSYRLTDQHTLATARDEVVCYGLAVGPRPSAA